MYIMYVGVHQFTYYLHTLCAYISTYSHDQKSHRKLYSRLLEEYGLRLTLILERSSQYKSHTGHHPQHLLFSLQAATNCNTGLLSLTVICRVGINLPLSAIQFLSTLSVWNQLMNIPTVLLLNAFPFGDMSMVLHFTIQDATAHSPLEIATEIPDSVDSTFNMLQLALP